MINLEVLFLMAFTWWLGMLVTVSFRKRQSSGCLIRCDHFVEVPTASWWLSSLSHAVSMLGNSVAIWCSS